MPTLPSNTSFLTTMKALTVTGVDRYYDEPPASIDISAGEAAFLTMPDSSRGEQISTCINQSKTRSIGFVIIVDAAGQGTQAQNYGKLAALMDSLETSLDALAPGTVNFIEYEIGTTGNYSLGGSDYWAIIATITARDI